MLTHNCKEFTSPFHSISHLKALVGPQKKMKNLRIFQKWKPSLIKPKEAGDYNPFVKSLKVKCVPMAGKVENARSCSQQGNFRPPYLVCVWGMS